MSREKPTLTPIDDIRKEMIRISNARKKNRILKVSEYGDAPVIAFSKIWYDVGCDKHGNYSTERYWRAIEKMDERKMSVNEWLNSGNRFEEDKDEISG